MQGLTPLALGLDKVIRTISDVDHLVELFSVLQLCPEFGSFTQVWATAV